MCIASRKSTATLDTYINQIHFATDKIREITAYSDINKDKSKALIALVSLIDIAAMQCGYIYEEID